MKKGRRTKCRKRQTPNVKRQMSGGRSAGSKFRHLAISQFRYFPNRSHRHAGEVGDEIVDVKGAVGKRVLDCFAKERKEQRRQEDDRETVPRKRPAGEKKGYREEKQPVEEIIEAQVDDSDIVHPRAGAVDGKDGEKENEDYVEGREGFDDLMI